VKTEFLDVSGKIIHCGWKVDEVKAKSAYLSLEEEQTRSRPVEKSLWTCERYSKDGGCEEQACVQNYESGNLKVSGCL
jgi:hypothetical protein